MNFFRKIDFWLLPRNLNEQFSPYVWLIYLPLFFVPVVIFNQNPMELVWVTLTVLAFLMVYFHAHWVNDKHVIFHIVAFTVLSTLAAFVAPTAGTILVYAGAFCSRLKPIKMAFGMLIGIVIWTGFVSWLFHFSVYFYMPGIVFTIIVGLVNIYHYALNQNKQALILSRKETQRLAQVAERERIARDLHDLIGHTFSVITVKADLAGRLLDRDLEKARDEIKQLECISREALSQVREVVSGYRTSDILSEFANAKQVLAGLDIDFSYELENISEQKLGLHSKSNKELAIILRELVTNVIKHANADHVTAELKYTQGHLILTFEDNGQGFENNQHQGFGLQGIEERIEKLQGYFNMKPGGDNKGTLSEIGLPIKVL